MRVAVPVTGGVVAQHFGHCERFVLFEADPAEKKVLGHEEVEAPPHEPGLLPRWLADHGATVIVAGGMGHRARSLFAERGIEVVVGAPAGRPADVVQSWLDGSLRAGENPCDH